MTAFDLRPSEYEKPITADGHLTRNYENELVWDINTSSILTKLIQDTGRFAERYASDLFIDWQSVEKYINSGCLERCLENHTWFFGIRKDGVDHEAFITSRMQNNPMHWEHNYRKLFRLDAIVENDSYYTLTMKLQEISL